jgi:hypothetical protein
VVMNPALLASFVGGASSGALGATDTYFGGGGGALILISCDGSVDITGTIGAAGGGGGGEYVDLFPIPPHGGGAGGNVVIQGKVVSVTGQLFANGGGGGGGALLGTTLGAPGQDGTPSDTTAAAGGDILGGLGVGGRGGFVGGIPSAGTHPTADNCGPGAGGGSVGFLQIYTPMGTTPTVTPSHVSPAFQPNGVVETR